MSVLRLVERHFAISAGDRLTLGGGADANIRLSDDEGVGVQAIVEAGIDGRVIIMPRREDI